MTKLFGIPMDVLEVVLVATLVVALAAVGLLAFRDRVFFRLGVRNVRRRPGRTALITAGLMLGTAMIAAALATGDTMTRTVRSSAVTALGQTDELVSARGATPNLAVESGSATGVRYFPYADYARIRSAVSASPLVDGVAPAIIEPIAAQDVTSRQTEPQVTLFASNSADLRGFGAITTADGRPVSLAALAPGWVYLNQDAADKLSASAGDTVRVLAGASAAEVRVKAIVRFDGAGADGAAVLMPLVSGPDAAARTGPDQVRARVQSWWCDFGSRANGAGGQTASTGPDAARLAGEQDETGHAQARRHDRRCVRLDVHDIRVVLDRRRYPADLPDLHHARRRAPR